MIQRLSICVLIVTWYGSLDTANRQYQTFRTPRQKLTCTTCPTSAYEDILRYISLPALAVPPLIHSLTNGIDADAVSDLGPGALQHLSSCLELSDCPGSRARNGRLPLIFDKTVCVTALCAYAGGLCPSPLHYRDACASVFVDPSPVDEDRRRSRMRKAQSGCGIHMTVLRTSTSAWD